ncbi:MAG: aldehyde ferredoxin oxidoreductase family protein [Anaerolineales bacterium]|nr:aldehyde ferredoxin oxidoreductase family protein [Anaerolineales bacterium]MCX7756685.1 aldehyde ferredoxin oxidoreductase family protein [Anaerolineales bacterium]MDW8279264.1 aldehyde ferredoxin oxidoreductase family protein [Anaerolineales bacterium]
MPHGYTGKILHVDLTTGTLTIETPPESFYRTYMGGSAMGLYYILKEMPVGVDALAPENVLTIFTGVTTGASVSGQSRVNLNAKSPISGAIGDSQGGGFFPAELKFAGFDGIVVKGRSSKPVYLWLKDGVAELRDASHLTGKVTGEAEALLKQELGDDKIEVLQHGPAAEKGVLFSSAVSMSNRNNGRTGMGLVMASKNLRAVVVRGTQKPSVADPKALAAINRLGPKWMPDNPDMAGLGKYGTASVVMPQHSMGTLPTRNYNEGAFEFAEEISGETLYEKYLRGAAEGKQDKLGRDTCYACVVRCKRVVELEGKYPVDEKYGGPEYETIGTFGSYCGVKDLAAISRANQICNMYGVDTIACGATLAWAMECYEKGILTPEDTGGLELKFGNADAMLAALEQIVTASTDFGRLLGQGSERAARVIGRGAEECLITVKGAEAPAHMPQAKRSLALIYAVNPFGADHQSSEHDWMIEEGIASDLYLGRMKLLGLENPLPPMSLGPEKVKFAYLTEAFYAMMDSVELCQFVWGPGWTLYGPQETAEMVKAVTGWDVTIEELVRVGERRIHLMRVFNAREGFDRKQDKLPKKFFKALQGEGPTAGIALSHDEIEAALDEYYRLAGFTPDGRPTPDRLTELDLAWAAALL